MPALRFSVVPVAVAMIAAIVFFSAPIIASATHGGFHATAQRDASLRDTSGRDGTERPEIEPTRYLSQIYLWFMGFVGIAALFAFVVGGIMWMLSTSFTSTATARKWIINGIWGIALAAASYLLLYTINPDLVEHGFDLQRIINRLAPSPEPSTARPSGAVTSAGSCPTTSCTRLAAASVPVKPGACRAASALECQVDRGLADKLGSLTRDISREKTGDYWRVTEAWPPTVTHQNPCHRSGTCVDANLLGASAGNPQEISYFVRKAEAVGLRPIYEVRNQTRADALAQAGVPRGNIQVVASIDAEHFSVYQ